MSWGWAVRKQTIIWAFVGERYLFDSERSTCTDWVYSFSHNLFHLLQIVLSIDWALLLWADGTSEQY